MGRGGDGLGGVLLVGLALVHGLGVGGGVVVLLRCGLHRGPLLHHFLVSEWVQVDVADEVCHWVLRQALGHLGLLEELVDNVEHTNSDHCGAKNLGLSLIDSKGGIPEKQCII